MISTVAAWTVLQAERTARKGMDGSFVRDGMSEADYGKLQTLCDNGDKEACDVKNEIGMTPDGSEPPVSDRPVNKVVTVVAGRSSGSYVGDAEEGIWDPGPFHGSESTEQSDDWFNQYLARTWGQYRLTRRELQWYGRWTLKRAGGVLAAQAFGPMPGARTVPQFLTQRALPILAGAEHDITAAELEGVAARSFTVGIVATAGLEGGMLVGSAIGQLPIVTPNGMGTVNSFVSDVFFDELYGDSPTSPHM